MNDKPHNTIMDNKNNSHYEIIVDGKLDESWMDWLGCIQLHYEQGQSVFMVDIRDQAALYGVLVKILNLGLSLTGLTRMKPPEYCGEDKNETEYSG